MRTLGWVTLPLALSLLSCPALVVTSLLPMLSLDSPLHEQLAQKVTCSAGKPTRSSDSLFLGSGDEQHILHMEFQFSELTSNQSSFAIRTFDPEGIIFYGDVGKNNWFVLGIRERKLEVQMNNDNGQMLLSKWGPDISDGKWRKVTVDSGSNTVEVRVDGELVVKLIHHVSSQPSAQIPSMLRIILGNLPAGTKDQLIKPIQPALDGCMRNWAWVKKDAHVLEVALNADENRRCFEQEEPGTFFPPNGYAVFKPEVLHTVDIETWGLSIKLLFRVVENGGILLLLHDGSKVAALTVALDCQKKALIVTLEGNLIHSESLPEDVCSGHWEIREVHIKTNEIQANQTKYSVLWDINPVALKALKDVWLDPAAQLFVGGIPDDFTKAGPYFSGCLQVTVQGQAVSLDSAQYNHPHVRSHSCPQGTEIKPCSGNEP
ncbi:sex hormone-binding globulin [Xenopus laevis]|uniref:Sex hormone-binding globulin n=2 Tax=Xenopus laevis TaxID=8355 RepID=A0A1L8GBG3_XENLA|nr:sex hormone-binding globulin [Xenopus laevis]OCT81105.1 hypothetical protein XELAEV_18027918mg [Xenopus laevis]